jgi:hypothetical protein
VPELVGVEDRPDGDDDAVCDLERRDPDGTPTCVVEDDTRLAVDECRAVA